MIFTSYRVTFVSVEAQIYEQLKEVMQTADLDEVTSRDIRLKVDFKFIIPL